MNFLKEALMQDSSTLTSLDVSQNPIGNTGLDTISSLFESQSCKLTSLNISECKIYGKGARRFFKAIKLSNMFKVLTANKNDFSYEQMKKDLAFAVSVSIVKLNMDHC